ncbi:hypothetical protein BC941DRAFT_389822 [Chlamydoabsidia padenii]|nr:hypothetical protein BC941DRAFT_389822 [Chlamydoabsidia padenii]
MATQYDHSHQSTFGSSDRLPCKLNHLSTCDSACLCDSLYQVDTPSSRSSSFSSSDLHYLYDQDQYPSPQEFDSIIQDYLVNLSCKKRDKALVDQQRYSLILQVLKDPRNTAISTAQFRFWVKKMFQLLAIKNGGWVVCHDDKPVATQEQIYPILIRAHRDAHHGGRDKTSALVRKQYSWIPKELIARFVRRCPFCISRRNGHPHRQPSSPNNKTTTKKNNKPNHPYLYETLSWEEKKDHQQQPNIAASIATSAAATAVSTQWIEPGTTFYYYSQPPFSSPYADDYCLNNKVMNTSPSSSPSSASSTTSAIQQLSYQYDDYYYPPPQDKSYYPPPPMQDSKPDMSSYVLQPHGTIDLMSLQH